MTEQATQHEQVVIIGSGPAGLTAAIYTGRAALHPLVISGWEPGGQLTTTTDVENYPGFPEGIMGPEMMEKFRLQAERFGTRFLHGAVSKVDFETGPPHRLFLDSGEEITCDTLIITTGSAARWLGLPSEDLYKGWGVSACATCDGAFFKDEPIFVVGGGDSAMEEGTYLTKFGKKVTIVHRRDELRASKIMQERAFNNPKVEFAWNSEVAEIIGKQEGFQKKVTGIRLRDTQTGEINEFDCGAVFIAIGHTPNSEPFRGHLEMDENGYILVEPGSTRTNVAGVFAAGDIVDHVYQQAITASGMGCMAAIDAERFLAAQD